MKNKSVLFGKLFMMCFLMAFTFISNAAGFKGAQEKNVVAAGITAYPSNWFVQMKWNKVQVLLRSTDIDLGKAKVTINYPGVKVIKVVPFSNSSPKKREVSNALSVGTSSGMTILSP